MIVSKFITRKEEVVAVMPVAASIDVAELYPYLFTLENKVLKKLLDPATFEDLELAYAAYVAGGYNPSLLDVWETQLLIRVQMALVNLAVREWAPFTIGQISGKGVTEAGGETKAARESTINRMLDAALKNGNEGVEESLTWLDDNRPQYPNWENSVEMTALFDRYMPTAKDFNEYFNIGESRYTFLRIMPQVKKAEQTVNRVIWEMAAELKAQQLSKSLTSANLALMALVKKAVANLAMVDALLMMSFEVGNGGVTISSTSDRQTMRVQTPVGDPRLATIRQQAKDAGAEALVEIRDLIYNNIADYPTFSAGAHYTPETPAPERFVNETTDKIALL